MTAPGQRRLSIWAVLAVVVALVAAHCITGFAVYGTGGRRGGGARLLQVGSLSLSDAPAAMVQQAVKQKWSSELEPTERSLEEQGEAMLAAMRATARLSAEVAAVKKAEQRAKAPAPREPLSQQLRPPTSGQQPTILLQVGDKTGAGISALGVGVRSFSHFEAAGRGQGDDYFQSRFRYGGGAGITQQLAAMHHEAEQAAAQQTETAEETHMEARMHRVASVRTGSHPRRPGASVRGRGGSQVHVMTARKQQSLLQPNVYPAVGYPFEQTSIDTANSNGPAKTFDTPPHVTCPAFIPNCKPQYNTLTECDFSCGSYCQAIRGDGPCLSGDAEGEGRDCKFGYRGARDTPSLADEEESGWLERPSMWGKGGPKDCMTCPVGFKIKPLYGDGTGACVACDEGWVDSDTGQITEAGCGGGQFIKLEPGDEPGQATPSEDYAMVAGCLPTPEVPRVGAQILAKIPDDTKETEFFHGYPGDYYPAQIMGADEEDGKMAIKFADGGPFVGLDPGVDAKALGDEFVALPKVGDKVTISSEYWDSCCDEAYDPDVDGPLALGDVGEVTSALPPEANDPAPYTVLAPNGVRWMYGAGQVLPLIGEVKCPLPGLVKINTVGNEMNQLKEVEEPPEGMESVPEDPECCCCTRDLWVGCWGWCGDGSGSTPTLTHDAPAFRAGEGALPGQVGGPCRGEYSLEEPAAAPLGGPSGAADSPDCIGRGRRPGETPK